MKKQKDVQYSAVTMTTEPKTLIAVPCADMMPVEFVESFVNLRKGPGTGYAFLAGSLVYDSRDKFAMNAMEKGYDRVLWIDSDMMFEPDLMERLADDIGTWTGEHGGIDFVSALCFKRKLPTEPCVYKTLEYQKVGEHNGTDIMAARAVSFRDYPKDTLFEIAGSGFGAVMTSVDMLRSVMERYGQIFHPLPQMGEDLSFCYRATEMGYRLWCDSRVKVGHVGKMIYTERVYDWQQQNGWKIPWME